MIKFSVIFLLSTLSKLFPLLPQKFQSEIFIGYKIKSYSPVFNNFTNDSLHIFYFVPDNRSHRNPLFDYFETYEKEVKCKICGILMAYKQPSYMTSVARHLKRHQKFYAEYLLKKINLQQTYYPLDFLNHGGVI